jgi:hypothetical protein
MRHSYKGTTDRRADRQCNYHLILYINLIIPSFIWVHPSSNTTRQTHITSDSLVKVVGPDQSLLVCMMPSLWSKITSSTPSQNKATTDFRCPQPLFPKKFMYVITKRKLQIRTEGRGCLCYPPMAWRACSLSSFIGPAPLPQLATAFNPTTSKSRLNVFAFAYRYHRVKFRHTPPAEEIPVMTDMRGTERNRGQKKTLPRRTRTNEVAFRSNERGVGSAGHCE